MTASSITTALIPQENEKDLADIPKNIKEKLNIIPVRWIDQVLELALQHMPVPKTDEQKIANDESGKSKDSSAKGVRAH